MLAGDRCYPDAGGGGLQARRGGRRDGELLALTHPTAARTQIEARPPEISMRSTPSARALATVSANAAEA